MRVHSVEKIEKLKELRSQGYSINELVEKLAMPKTTIWHHIHSIKLLPIYVSRIRSRQGGSRKRKEARIKEAEAKARIILSSRHREAMIALVMLYWGEGHKGRCDFINTDGNMISFYLQTLRNVFNIPNDGFMPTMRIFSGMDREECLSYWSKVTGFPKKQFKIRFNDGMTRGRSEHGMCRIIVRKGGNFLKIFYAIRKQFLGQQQ